jgi:hypothetical protein
MASKAAARDPFLEIDIAGRNLTDEGFAVFIDDLIACLQFRGHEHPQGVVRLAELHLQRNNLTTLSLKKLARVVSLSFGDLRELDLSGNEIMVATTEEKIEWQEFLRSFKNSYMLKKLDFSSNPLGLRGLEILSRVYMQSELDFFETGQGDSQKTRVVQQGILNSEFSMRSLEISKENHKPGAKVSSGLRTKARSFHQVKGECLQDNDWAVSTDSDCHRPQC